MCRAHRAFVSVTGVLWVVVLALVLANPGDDSPLHTLTILLGCLAVVLVPYCLFPWLVRDMLHEELKDVGGAFLAGWEAAKDDAEPKEPARIYSIR